MKTYKVVKANVLDNYLMLITFSNNEVRVFDIKQYFEKGPVFVLLKDYNNFKDFTIDELGCIECASGASLQYDNIYSESKPYQNQHFRSSIEQTHKIQQFKYLLRVVANSDKRRNPIYSTGHVILPVLFGFMIRIQSFNELNDRIKSNDFKRLVSM